MKNGSLFLFVIFAIQVHGVLPVAGQTAQKNPVVLENDFLQITFSAGVSNGKGALFEVLDRRTQRIWKQAECRYQTSGFDIVRNKALFNIKLPGIQQECRATVFLEPDKPEFTVEVDGPIDSGMAGVNVFPPAFLSEHGDRIIVPVCEGISYPVETADAPLGYRPYYRGHGVTMGFFGMMEDLVLPSGEATGGSAYMVICETPDNSGIDLVSLPPVDAAKDRFLLTVQQAWVADRGRFGYARKIRYVFFDCGGHVAMCKRYRKYVQKKGYVVPFAEKISRNPARHENLGKLFGAANIWVLSGNFRDKHKNLYDEISGNYRSSAETTAFMDAQLAIYRDMHANGMDHLLIGAGADVEHLKQINAIDGALSSRYDIYQDLMDPAQYDNLTAIKNEWPKEAFPQDLRISSNGEPARGWRVPLKKPVVRNGKTNNWIKCYQLCDRQAPFYVRKRIAEELKIKPYTCRFIDVTACSTWEECWSPDHPMTRTESGVCKAKILEIPGEEFNLVFGSETGHEKFVPMCDYFEGMMSLIVCRVPDSGRNMTRIWDEVPQKVAKYQTGEAYRLPLFELVFHDCIVNYWYWGDYNNKLPALWGKRDLFNALYGVPPMYVVTPDNWSSLREGIFASYKVAEPVSKLTAQSEMIDHRILTADRGVQQSVFANGVRVTVNFGAKDYTMDGSFILKAGKSRIEEGK